MVKLKDNGLDEIFTYLPAPKTAFYEGSRNGSIWRLENTKDYRNIRNNIGASTAEVIKRIKALKSGDNELVIIASILENGKYGIYAKDLVNDIFTDEMASFISLAIILGNPSDHDLKTADIENNDENHTSRLMKIMSKIRENSHLLNHQPDRQHEHQPRIAVQAL